MEAIDEGRLIGGTRALTGGLDALVTGFSPDTEGLETRDGGRIEPVGFFTIFEAAAADRTSGTSEMGLGCGTAHSRQTDLGIMRPKQGTQLAVFQIWRVLRIER